MGFWAQCHLRNEADASDKAEVPECLLACGLWEQQAILVDTSVPPNGLHGWSGSISADGNTAIVGGPWTDVSSRLSEPSPFPPPAPPGFGQLGRSVEPASKTGRHR